MQYFIAIIGAIFIFVATFILTAFLVPFLPPVLKQSINLGFFQTNNIVGTILAFLAAGASYRGTLRRYSKRKQG